MPNNPKFHTSGAARMFVVGIWLATTLLEIWSGINGYQKAINEERTDCANLAFAMTKHAEEIFKQIDIVMQEFQDRREIGSRGTFSRQAIHQLLIDRVASLPQLAELSIYDARGISTLNSQPLLEKKYDYSHNDNFIHHRNNRGRKLFIGNPVRSQITKQWVIPVSQRLDEIDGTFAGIVVASIELDYLNRFYAQFLIGRKGAILIGLDTGHLIYRLPHLPDPGGMDIANLPLFRDHVSKSQKGSTETLMPSGQSLYIASFFHSTSYHFFIVAARNKNEVLHEWVRRTGLHGVAVLFLLFIIRWGGTKLVLQIRRREVAEANALESRRELENAYQAAEILAKKDGLTGIYNRRYFDKAIEEALEQRKRRDEPLSLLMVDIDYFKKFNDIYGHTAGDVCIKRVSAAIASVMRSPRDVLARYGGEEFILILPSCGANSAFTIAQRIVDVVRAAEIPHQENATGRVTVSVGATSLLFATDIDVDARELIDLVDAALYEAKNLGRDRCVFREFGRTPRPSTADPASVRMRAFSST